MSFKGEFSGRIAALVDRAVEVAALRLHLERLGDVCLAERQADDEDNSRTAAPPAGDLVLTDAAYRYGAFEPWLLQGQSLRIREGECVAIMGPSGSGKSTLLRILLGQLALNHGRLAVGSRRLGPDSAPWFAAATATVLQDDALFAGTVADNVTLFDPAPDATRLEAALVAAGALPVVAALPAGVDTPLGESAAGLSGGQRQRLLLARAFYRRPRYLFLDEATAHLDGAAAALLQETLAGLGCTRVLVTHDAALAGRADRVLWLQGGSLTAVTMPLPEAAAGGFDGGVGQDEMAERSLRT
jgi:ATP-binding cassette subfamily B protein RaxB